MANDVEVKISAKDDTGGGFDSAIGKTRAFEAAVTRSYASQARAAKLLRDANKLLGDETAATAEKAGQSASAFASMAGPGGMGAAIIAGVALSPVLLTVGTGLLGVGAAAFGVAKPILNAAQATGGLQANMAKLNPEQRKVAQGLLGLGQQFGAFQKQMQPAVFTIFNQGLRLAGTLLHGIEPVALATGKALGQVLGQVGAEFRSGEWQQFFAFMARTAAPDVRLLGDTFTHLLGTIPPLTQDLQPLARGLLVVSDDAAKAAHGLAGMWAAGQRNVPISTQHTFNFLRDLDRWTVSLTNHLPGGKAINNFFTGIQHSAGGAGAGMADAGDSAAVAGPKFFSLNAAVRQLNTSMTKLVGNLLTLQGSELSWKQSLQAAQAQLKSNTAGLEGNSKNALANRAAVLASTQAAVSFAQQELATGKNIDGASRTVQSQIRWLAGLHDKSQFVRDELAALRKEEQLLEAERLRQTIKVEGLGTWSVTQSLAPGVGHRRARGGLIPGTGSADSYPALLTPGELVVPTGMVKAGAVDHLRGRLPGFAGGGLVPSYSGAVGGLSPWLAGNDQATIRLIDQAVVKATVAGMRAAQSAASGFGGPGPGGGAPAANAALARRMMTDWSTGANWAAWNYVAMRESGWNQFARNPSSGAYGIAQALPPTKYPFAGQAAGGSNPAAQISWMVGYMQSVYGGPIGAAAHERAFNWYDHGGWLPPGTSVAVNNTGRPEQVLAPGGGQPMVLEIRGGGSGFDDFMFTWLRKNARIRGGNVQLAFGR